MKKTKKLLPIGIAAIVIVSMLALMPLRASAGDTINVPLGGSIQEAIDAANPGDTVLVAPGTFTESITMKAGVTLQGSGAGATTIKGDPNINWVVKGANESTISGFTVTGGNHGILNISSSPIITNNIISGNSSAGILNSNSSPKITNNIISGNSWDGVYNISSSATITNNTIIGNKEDGVYNLISSATITNNIITGNVYYGISSYSSSLTISYNDVWGNLKGSYLGCSAGPDDISEESLFVDAASGDYHLQSVASGYPEDSPCIDAGDNEAPELPETDADGNDRIVDGDGDGVKTVDMGAFEYVVIVSNTSPVADAGPDQTVEQESYEGTEVTLDGSGSKDLDTTPGTNDDIVAFDWYEGDILLGSGESINHTFPLGKHTVTLAVTDSFDEIDKDNVIILVLGPWDIKKNAVSELKGAETDNTRVDKVINRVISLIDKSLRAKYWTDDLHLDPKRGGKVFIYEGLAVGKMKLHIKHWEKRGPTPEQQEAIDVFELVIPKLVKADKLLAQTAIAEANDIEGPSNPGKSRAWDRFLAKADKAFEKALRLIDKERPGLAIIAFKRAWKFAQLAMKLAQ